MQGLRKPGHKWQAVPGCWHDVQAKRQKAMTFGFQGGTETSERPMLARLVSDKPTSGRTWKSAVEQVHRSAFEWLGGSCIVKTSRCGLCDLTVPAYGRSATLQSAVKSVPLIAATPI